MKGIDYFLKLDGVPGESTAVQHKDEIDLLAFSWAETQATPAPGGGGSAGKVEFSSLHATAHSSKASPLLLLACANGKHIKEALLTAASRKKKGKTQDFLVIKLVDVLVSAYSISGEQDSFPVDHFDLSFSKIEMEYTPTNPDGSPDAPVKAGWDLKTNKQA
jgi:type VI secretion system secreted protein Hcp